MHTLKRYRVSYLVLGEPDSLEIEAFEAPSLDQARQQILHKHLGEPQVTTDARWEDPVRHSERSRVEELGVSDIRIEPAP